MILFECLMPHHILSFVEFEAFKMSFKKAKFKDKFVKGEFKIEQK